MRLVVKISLLVGPSLRSPQHVLSRRAGLRRVMPSGARPGSAFGLIRRRDRFGPYTCVDGACLDQSVPRKHVPIDVKAPCRSEPGIPGPG